MVETSIRKYRSESARTVIAVVALFALSACTPEFDWRELTSNDGGFSVLMPSKPRYEERSLADAPGVTMHLWSAHAAKSVFGVGYADYPVAGTRLLDATRDALVANIRGRLLEEKPITSNGLAGLELTAESDDRVLQARLLLSGTRLFQLVALGPKKDLRNAAEEVDLFLSSLRPLAAPRTSAGHLRQNDGVKITNSVNSSSRPSSIATVQTHV